MKIATWNVNSIRAREDVVLDWLEANEPDVLCVQETKVTDQEFPEDGFADLHYEMAYFGQRTYNGVAIFGLEDLKDVVRGLPGDGPDAEKRLIAATVDGVRVINVYVPNGQQLGSEKYKYKLAWLDKLQTFVAQELKKHDQLVLCGDFNIAPTDDDVWDLAAMESGLFISDAERAKLKALLDCGLQDSLKQVSPAKRQFTWWDYRGNGYAKNMGMRIDHLLVTPKVIERAQAVKIHKRVRGGPSPSDHVPVVLELGS